MWLLGKSKSKLSSRYQIRIKEVKDDVLVLPNNEYRVLVETSSINFELKSEEEQDVLIDSFQNFLNSLPCELQILIRIREVDIDRYLEQISQTKNQEKIQIYKNQITNYCQFIRNVVSGNKILSRRFYVIIPYRHSEKNQDFYLIKEQLNLRKDIVQKGLEKLGMKARLLNSLEILDLFYSFYNPAQIKTQELKGQTIQMLLQNTYV
ncbi:MAG: conjugal transfer protein TraC [Patescibacteria group bacterium]|nr:conjugal transfer protein TraC [Patescibacteria group bacterium]